MGHSPSRLSTAACTIIARNYLAQARVLVDSYLQYAPGAAFYLFVVDGPPTGLDLQPGVRLLGPDDVPMPEFREMSFKYDVTELCTAVKPALLQFILSDCHEESVVYFDPDIVIFRDLSEMRDCLATSDIVLIPHLLDPIPLDGLLPDEKAILASGAYNLGFIALRASAETARLLQWWRERLQDNCRMDIANGLFVDQKWIDLVPSLFSGTAILRDDTYDVAYWNLHSRGLEREGNQVWVNGRPLAFFHFSGFDPGAPRVLSKHQNRLSVENGTALAYLLDTYVGLVHQRGFRLAQQWRYGYAWFDNRVLIPTLSRHLYHSLDVAQRAQFGDPFRVDGQDSFFSWSVTPSAELNDLSPLLERLLLERPHTRDEIPDPRGHNREQFVRWAMTEGATEMKYDPVLADLAFWSQANSLTSSVLPARESEPLAGVNICGGLHDETGPGAVALGFIRALRGDGIPLGIRDLSNLVPDSSEDPPLPCPEAPTDYGINLVCVNVDQQFDARSLLGVDFFRDRYNIGVWCWDFATFPHQLWDRFDSYDEIWATSSFGADALTPVSPLPVVRIPPVLVSTLAPSRASGRERLGVDSDEFVYLFTFDFATYFDRQNPLAVIEAFRQSYKSGDEARLVIKCMNEHIDKSAFDRMIAHAADLPVSIHTGHWSPNETSDLIAACDAYVSLHRSEGLGLAIGQAMGLGKPTIATRWSANSEFMSSANSFPVSCERVRLTRDCGPYRAGSEWAEPSIAEASRFMRLVYDDRALARAAGDAARRDIMRDYSEQRVSNAIQQRLAIVQGRKHTRESFSVGVGIPPGQVEWDGSLMESHEVGESRADDTGELSADLATPPAFVPPVGRGRGAKVLLRMLAKGCLDSLRQLHTRYVNAVNPPLAAMKRELDERQAGHERDLRELFRRSDLTDPARLRRMDARVEHLTAELRLVAGLSRRVEELNISVGRLETQVSLVAGLAERVDELIARVERLTS